jgi:hypothetical protein
MADAASTSDPGLQFFWRDKIENLKATEKKGEADTSKDSEKDKEKDAATGRR